MTYRRIIHGLNILSQLKYKRKVFVVLLRDVPHPTSYLLVSESTTIHNLAPNVLIPVCHNQVVNNMIDNSYCVTILKNGSISVPRILSSSVLCLKRHYHLKYHITRNPYW